MVMDTTLRAKDINDDALRTLGTQIHTLLGEASLGIKCTFKNNRLVVLGEHADTVSVDSATLLDRLERNIQALQIQFTQHVRLYLRQLGKRQPYAYRQFVLAPPPPLFAQQGVEPVVAGEANAIQGSSGSTVSLDDEHLSPLEPSQFTPPELPQPQSAIDEQPWIVGDAELDALVNQLTALDPLENWDLASQDGQFDESLERELSMGDDEINQEACQENSPKVSPPADPLEPEVEANDLGFASAQEAIAPSQSPILDQTEEALEEEQPLSPVANADDESASVGTTMISGNDGWLDHGLIPDAAALVLSNPDTQNEADIPPESDKATRVTEAAALALQPQSSALTPSHSLTPLPALVQQEVSMEKTPLAELSSLVVAESEDVAQPGFHSFTYETSQRLKELSQSFLHPRPKSSLEKADAQQPTATAHLENNGQRRVAIASLGLASLGFAAGVYGATRPCVLGSCTALQDADRLGDKSQRMMQKAQTWVDVEATIPPLNQALEMLEPIPVWSSHSAVAQQQIETYTVQLEQIHQLLDVEQAVKYANQVSSQSVYSLDDLLTVRSLWESAIDDLDLMPIDSPLHSFAQDHLADYQPQLVQVEQQLQHEEAAKATLDTAKEAAQLAQARQGVAQSLENWQFARVTWLVALNRLKQVGEGTLASKEAERLLDFYQTSLDEVNVHVSREQVSAQSLQKAEQQAQIATAAERRHDWQQAIADWNDAIEYIQQIDSTSTYYLKAEGLLAQYQDAISQVQDKLKAKTLIEGELKQSCIGELQLCHIVSIDQSIKLELDESYMDAISTARGNGNYNLQAVVTDHQLMVRQSLDRIANNFDLPIEVYNPDGGLLERHLPKPR